MDMTGNTVLITGGTSGLGLGFAQALAKKGNQVIITSRRQAVIDTLIKKNPQMTGYAVDVADKASVERLRETIEENHPSLNMVIHSAGIMKSVNFFDEDAALTEEVETNLMGTILIDKAFLPLLSKQKEAMLVNISSGLSYVASTAHPIYSATKAGVNALTDAIRGQAAYFGYENVHIVQVAPPLVSETNLEPQMHESGEKNPLNMKLTTFVDTVLKGLEKNKSIINPGPSKLLYTLGKIGTVKGKIRATRNTMTTVFGQNGKNE